MEKYCDLHSHSLFSDGTNTPEELVELAEKQGLYALALTDHNTSAGLKRFMEAGKNSKVITVPGCEFSTEWNKKEIHIVGLFFKEECWNEIEDFVELALLAKTNSNRTLIKKLNEAGYEVSEEEVIAISHRQEYNRSHVARVLMSKGYVESIDDAFNNLLKEGNGFYTSPNRITSIAAIRFIKTFGATAIMAHPFLNLNYDELLEFLPQAIEAGLDAIETNYSEFDEKTTELAISLTKQFNLKRSGGSDYHGKTKPHLSLGIGRGNLKVPFEFYENLLKSAKEYK